MAVSSSPIVTCALCEGEKICRVVTVFLQRVEPLAGEPIPDPLEAASWLDVNGNVAVVGDPALAGLGVALPPGSSDASGTIRRLAPGPLVGESAGGDGVVGVRLDRVARPVVAVRFDVPDGLALPSGVYALALRWREADQPRSATWVVEVRPEGDGPTTSLLDAARRYASHAGSGTLVFSGAGRRQQDPAAAPVRALPLGASVGCGANIVDETPAVLGFALADGESLQAIVARISAPLGRAMTVPLRVARDVLPGLSLVAPVRGAALAAGIYRFTLETTAGTREMTVCLGTSPFSG